jgi:phosphoribosylformylglycinamidine synthase subunit PurL
MTIQDKTTLEQAKAHGLTPDEFHRICDLLERAPNFTELGVFSVMWSEHCSYKSSRPFLRKLPTEGPRVLQGPGENAGVVDIGDGQAVVFKIESHNHPSFVEPRQGAATGVGGILRDVFTMGARPIALLNSLRFGEKDNPRTRYLLNGVVDGIAGYGNCVGVPTVGGEIYFDKSYNGNNLVNAFCIGLVDTDKIFLGKATGAGNAVIYFGSKTGRDGIHGASLLASSEFDETTEEKRPTVQVGDPFTEKLLIEATLELLQQDWVVGIQDMGAAGLTSSTFEMASRGETGVELNVSKVPLREEGMTPYEILLSESQERMLAVVKAEFEDDAIALLKKWDLDAAVIGRVIEEPVVRIIQNDVVYANLPVSIVVDGALDLRRKTAKPKYLLEIDHVDLTELPEPERGDAALKRLLGSLNISSREWIYQQYDHMVQTNTLILPGSDASVLRIKGSTKGIALSVDCNSRYCFLDPFRGAQIAVAECSRNIVCSGAEPIGLTNCLNFGNPEKPDIMWQFEQSVLGIAEACKFLDIPVVSGNVSLYNETKGVGIHPTPTVAVVGLIEDINHTMTQWFKNEGDCIALIGLTMEELAASEYLNVIFDVTRGVPPLLELARERKNQQLCLDLIREGLLHSAHDCAEGGLAVALAESCFTGPKQTFGAEISLQSTLRKDALAFGESQSRILISFAPGQKTLIEQKAEKAGVDFEVLGSVKGNRLTMKINDEEYISTDTAVLKDIWKNALGDYARQIA